MTAYRAVIGAADYRTAIESTEGTILYRASVFRAQIIIVAATTCSIVVAAAVLWAGLLSALVLLLPLCGSFVAVDARIVHRWRQQLLAAWSRCDIDLTAYRQAVKAHPLLPPGTLNAMLATLPATGSLMTEQAIGPPTRAAAAAAALARDRRDGEWLLLKVAGSGIVAGFLVAATVGGSWFPLLGYALLPLLPAIGRWRTRRIRQEADAAVSACRRDGAFSDADFSSIDGALM